jgi:hypothetical protein
VRTVRRPNDDVTGGGPQTARVPGGREGNATASLDETLHLDEFAGMCGRVERRYPGTSQTVSIAAQE